MVVGSGVDDACGVGVLLGVSVGVTSAVGIVVGVLSVDPSHV